MADQTYVEELIASSPSGIVLPQPIVDTLQWMEANGFVHELTMPDGSKYRSMFIYPSSQEMGPGHSVVEFKADPSFMTYWNEGHGADAVFVFVKTGGDGSRAGLWRDEAGQLRFVHLGSGSGSAWVSVLTDDPIDFLRFLAVGYIEPASEASDTTPLDAYLRNEGFDSLEEMREEYGSDEDGDDGIALPVAPTAFQDFIRETFGRPIPETGLEVVPASQGNIDDDAPTDPFHIWLRSTQSR